LAPHRGGGGKRKKEEKRCTLFLLYINNLNSKSKRNIGQCHSMIGVIKRKNLMKEFGRKEKRSFDSKKEP